MEILLIFPGFYISFSSVQFNHSVMSDSLRPYKLRSTLLSQSGEEKGSDEVVPGTSVFPLSESGMSRNFWGRIKGAKYRFALQDGTWDFS